MTRQSRIYSGNTIELRPSLRSVVRVVIEGMPVLGDLFHRYYLFARRGIACRGVYASHEEALQNVHEGNSTSFDTHHEVKSLEAELKKEHPVRYEDYAVLFWLRGLMRPGIRIMDLGGSTGRSYYEFSDALELPDDASWLVAELPAAAEIGTKVAAARGADRLSFTNKLAGHHKPDVLLTIGTLQYIDERLSGMLSRIGKLPEHIIIHKVPVTDGPEFWTIQGLPLAEVPYYIHNRDELIADVVDLGYELIDTCDTLRGIRIPFHPSKDVHHYSGFFFRRIH